MPGLYTNQCQTQDCSPQTDSQAEDAAADRSRPPPIRSRAGQVQFRNTLQGAFPGTPMERSAGLTGRERS